MSTRSFISHITPLPSNIHRESAIAHLHDHVAMIELNPLVLRHEPTDPPPNAPPDEAEHATWYQITDRINYLPGGAAKGEVVYKACFYNLPNGLQTHTFAPGGIDIRDKWTVGGSGPGEPKQPEEMGSKAPRDRLFIKEEVELRCNILVSNFVKRNLNKSHTVLAQRLVARVEKLQGMQPISPIWERGHSGAAYMDFDLGRSPRGSWPLSPRSNSDPALPRPVDLYHSDEIPAHCLCQGTWHDPICAFFHPDDMPEYDLNRHVPPAIPPKHPYRLSGVPPSDTAKPFYAISLPSELLYSQPSSLQVSPEDARLPRELLGSPARDGCHCTGALHDRECPSYPGLRNPRFASPSSQQNTLPISPLTASTMNKYGFSAGLIQRSAPAPRTPQPMASNTWPVARQPHEFEASTSPDVSPDRGLVPTPLRSSTRDMKHPQEAG